METREGEPETKKVAFALLPQDDTTRRVVLSAKHLAPQPRQPLPGKSKPWA
jgi:hypothetical protein